MEIYQIDAIGDRRRSYSTDSHHCRSPHARSASSYSSSSSNARLRLADVAKQYGMGVHVDNWREDMHPIRQYLPMQHIIGSLKRDRDEQVQFIDFNGASLQGPRDFQRQSDIMAASPRSEDSFLQMLRTPKRRRTSDCSQSDSNYTTSTDPDRRFSYQAAAHIAKDLPQSALPGLNHILNLSTITADERDIFTEYAPKHLEDSQLLMTEVLQLREKMMNDEDVESEGGDDLHIGGVVDAASPVIPPERDAEVRKALEDFVEFHRHEKYIAKI